MDRPPVEAMGLVNHEVETEALGAMIDDTEQAIEMAQQLDASDFYSPRHQIIFEAVSNLLRGVERIDTKAIVAETKHVAKLRDTRLVISEDDVQHLHGEVKRIGVYISTIKQLASLRNYTDFAFWMVNEIQMRPDLIELHAEMQERLQHIAPKSVNKNFVYGWDTQPEHDMIIRARIEEFESGVVSKLSWPWNKWNDIVRPLREGMVGIIAAPDGMGKTTYLEQIAEHWAMIGKHVVYVHLEDARSYKYDRRLARHSGVPIEIIEDGTMSPDQLQSLRDGRERKGAWRDRLHYHDAAGDTAHAVVRELESRIREEVCDVVVIDYIDKFHASRAQQKLFGHNSWERQANDMETLKTFAERNGLPVLTATQGNKSMQSGGVQTRQAIQGSGQKSQKAQLVVILTRDIIDENGLHDNAGNLLASEGEYSPIVKVRIDKQNRGRTGGFEQYLIGKLFMAVDEIAEGAF